ncbi:N-acyl-phosphatidylethanolamine-hydrolysing phospholipase D [Marchantia polymorpha subsp. ruderalis]|uniref:Metallo-beta-lactamase domain-containing protein n=1 Tax=Marchantia polymorpha TaxID=3197 RepID=A0A2R6WJJ7_MARPO|nr:hypothetical protein MARPO_0083s0006 [Marchantia polymorpha]PTQ34037.1 hypothetical protein MARPO_0083s0006 [Marchantia polymorpha]BBN19730.1 hypothetical protein Mp_8g13150 [Marchantia polymorpha subsp. ruderalis]BBN19731.1 hypothetical protein Mp_8g13150 [Marchantia polymorpha subsp. ruderalis]|eukprot:PTQ34036.1 hypothetical protein MARPO_0083s0006 [Marchantia polymorpha]
MGSDDKEHHLGGGFRNPWPSHSFEGSIAEFFRMIVRGDWDRSQTTPSAEVRAQLGTPLKTEIGRLMKPPVGLVQTTWVGHATFLVQFDGLNVLTDPVWSDRCSPTQWVGPKRFMPVPFAQKELPPIDAVIISHNHYDHLDERTVKELGNKPLYLVPSGVKSWFTSLGITNVVELDWWQEHRVDFPDGDRVRSLRAVCTPCQHFSGRGAFDRNKTLWCSWVLEGQTKRVYFAGDTGFCTVPRGCEHPGGVPSIEAVPSAVNLPVCPAFEEIGKRFGPIDISFIPIGAYSPRYFMSSVHCSPEDAVAIHMAVGSKQSVAMHWGTFALTDEPIMEPPLRLRNELERLRIDPSRFITMKHGETRTF